jgi:hypothetical protein
MKGISWSLGREPVLIYVDGIERSFKLSIKCLTVKRRYMRSEKIGYRAEIQLKVHRQKRQAFEPSKTKIVLSCGDVERRHSSTRIFTGFGCGSNSSSRLRASSCSCCISRCKRRTIHHLLHLRKRIPPPPPLRTLAVWKYSSGISQCKPPDLNQLLKTFRIFFIKYFLSLSITMFFRNWVYCSGHLSDVHNSG